MSLYLDSSALLKRYIEEPESAYVEGTLLADPVWVSAQHTWVEVRRNLARLLQGQALSQARRSFERDWQRFNVVQLDEATCRAAADVAEATGARTLDALHLAALRRTGDKITLLTFDIRQAAAARALGLQVIGG